MDFAARKVQRAEQRRRWVEFKRKAATWVDDRLAVLPFHWRRRAAAEYARLARAVGYDANAWLLDLSDAARGRVSLAAGDDEITQQARRAALAGYDLCRMASARSVDVIERVLAGHCEAFGVRRPSCGGASAIARMLCSRWWLRRLRAAVARRCEAAAVGSRMVCRGVWPYASQDGVERRAAQRKRNALAVARAELIDLESGEIVALEDVVKGSVANPVIRRNELMTRIRGCEEYATARGERAEFWTVTTPSRFHASRMVGRISEPNPHYDKACTPEAGQRHLSTVFARWRSAIGRRRLAVYGMRVAEPHHDGTPHWHILAFGPDRDLRFARRLLRVYALRDCPDEEGARRYRYKADKIDPRRGDAAGYVAKYVAKNIDGFGVGTDEETGRESSKMVKRCDTWASAWRIRQFQFFGVPSVTLWRGLRKLSGPVAVPEVEAARAAADDGDWCRYMRAMDACAVGVIHRAARRLTAYGEQAPAVPDAYAARWKIAAARAAGGLPVDRVAIPRREYQIRWGEKTGGVGLSRTRVNNCTRPADVASQALIDRWAGMGEGAGARYCALTINRRN